VAPFFLGQILTDFHNFSCTTSQENAKVIGIKFLLPSIRYVATIPCESLRHKSNTFHAILALCTCLYRLHLRKPVSMKQTKHSRKSEPQNLCSKCPQFTQNSVCIHCRSRRHKIDKNNALRVQKHTSHVDCRYCTVIIAD